MGRRFISLLLLACMPSAFAADGPRDQIYRDTTGLELRNRPIDRHERTVVVIHAGQSNRGTNLPTLYIPPHTRQIDNYNVDDGNLYEIKGPMLGTSFADPPRHPGNVSAMIDEQMIARHLADRVISVTIAVDGSSIRQWSRGRLSGRLAEAVKSLRRHGIAPGPHVRFIVDWSQGPTDTRRKTPGFVWANEFRKVARQVPSALWFVSRETWLVGVMSPSIRRAQVYVCDGQRIFKSFNSDRLSQEYRDDRAGHYNDKGAAIVAAGVADSIMAHGPLFGHHSIYAHHDPRRRLKSVASTAPPLAPRRLRPRSSICATSSFGCRGSPDFARSSMRTM